MIIPRFLAALVAAVALSSASSFAANDSNELLDRMAKLNSNLRSYQADLHVNITMRSFPYLSPSLDGNAYFKRPDKNAVVFNSVPVLANQFKKVYPQIEPPSEWKSVYDITPVSDDGTSSTFKLVKKKGGRVDHVDVKVDDKTATVVAQTWTYKDGGYVSLTQSFQNIDGNYLVKSQTGKVELPSYKADLTSSFSNYKLNVALEDRVFEP